MTNKELLELAALAMGFTFWRSKHGHWHGTDMNGLDFTACNNWTRFDSYSGEEYPEPSIADALDEYGWFPLTDDGDALRLAVKLHIGLLIESWEAAAYAYNVAECREPAINGDILAATRRAIVRAAAEIGKSMKEENENNT